MGSKCYFPMMKQLMKQYFLLLNGKRPMIGNLTFKPDLKILTEHKSELGYYAQLYWDDDGWYWRFKDGYGDDTDVRFYWMYGAGFVATEAIMDFRTRNQQATDSIRFLSCYSPPLFKEVARIAEGMMKIYRAGDIQHVSDDKGTILIDRTTAIKYRLKVDNGVLGIEVA